MLFQAAVVVLGGVQRLDLATAWGADAIRALMVVICGFAWDRRASRARRLGSARMPGDIVSELIVLAEARDGLVDVVVQALR